MENKEIKILVDFCIFCGKLANLVPRKESKDKSVICDKCNKKSLRIRYKEAYQRRKKTKFNINSSILINDDSDDFKCQICTDPIDPDINLQCLACSMTFCFKCLLKWIYINSTCPNCRKEMTKSDIRPNNMKKKYVQKEEKQEEVSLSPKCDTHGEECYFYCNSCIMFICNKCVVGKIHRQHDFIEKEECIEKLLIETTKVLTCNQSPLQLIQDLDNEIVFSEHLNNKIHDDILNPLHQSLNNIKQSLKAKTDFLIEVKLPIIDRKEYQEEENSLKLFNRTKDPNLAIQVAKFLQKREALNEEINSITNSLIQKEKEYHIITIGCSKTYCFEYSLSNITKVCKPYVKEPAPSIYFIVRRKNTLDNQYIYAYLWSKNNKKCYCKLELEENNLCTLSENKMNEVNSKISFVRIGKIDLKVQINEITEHSQAKFHLTLCEFKDKIERHIKETKDYVLKSITDCMQSKESNNKEENKNDAKESEETYISRE